MQPFLTNIEATAEVAASPAAVFAHWMDPECRKRYEAPPESGMRYKNFAREPGDVEEIEITHEGEVVGLMKQELVVIEAPRLIVSQVTGIFYGARTLAMQVTLYFEDVGDGTRIRATSHVVDTTGRDVAAEHEAGWALMFEKFKEDFATFGPTS